VRLLQLQAPVVQRVTAVQVEQVAQTLPAVSVLPAAPVVRVVLQLPEV
jgi:hypothetical protein